VAQPSISANSLCSNKSGSSDVILSKYWDDWLMLLLKRRRGSSNGFSSLLWWRSANRLAARSQTDYFPKALMRTTKLFSTSNLAWLYTHMHARRQAHTHTMLLVKCNCIQWSPVEVILQFVLRLSAFLYVVRMAVCFWFYYTCGDQKPSQGY
jgi:hypothetical protein